MVSRGFYLLYTVPMPHSPGEKHPEVKKRSCFLGGRKGEIQDERKARRKNCMEKGRRGRKEGDRKIRKKRKQKGLD